jgi:hypothetical protein
MSHSESPSPPGREPTSRGRPTLAPTASGGDLFNSPADVLGCRDPAVLERLGELDDVVFEAIAGRTAALERLTTLWPEVLRLVGDPLVEESREAYIRHALNQWRQCAEAEPTRNPRLAVTLMDVLAILIAD